MSFIKSFAFLFPSSARSFILFLFSDTIAISADAKNALSIVKMTINISCEVIFAGSGSNSIVIPPKIENF
ncbi:hypothetical protein SDC9_116896 [bioreactor metagenome]|uniref:Uncharacterized protein n=1 Tax=bioreactor metagenome TaxID=1076179 RepID=A0A645BXW2_9ZZZZ